MEIDDSDNLDPAHSRRLGTRRCRHYLLERLYAVPLILWLLFDPVPRFFQGDSISYLSTGIGSWLPPDRSWEFGILVNLLLRHTHGLSAFILCQVGMLVVLVEGARVVFPQTPAARSGWALTAILIAVDPLIEVYTRFYLSDFLAMAFFLAAGAGVVLELRADVLGWRRIGPFALIFFGTLGAVILRVAYLPIMLLTVAFAAILMWRYLTRWTVAALLFAACGSVIAVGVTVGANRVVFAKEFPGQVFVNKLSGVFLAGVFAPALAQSDFQRAGIPITAEEFKNLDLSDYAKRNAQVWGGRRTDLQQLIKDNLHINDAYSRELNRAAWRLVISAVERDPWAFARIYLVDFADFAEPSAWRSQVRVEMGLTRSLPHDFVTLINQNSALKITPGLSLLRSPLIRAYEAISELYPLQLLLGFCAGVAMLLRTGPKPFLVLPFAAFCADLAAAPLYENHLIARYILGAIFLSYLLIGLAVSSQEIARLRLGKA